MLNLMMPHAEAVAEHGEAVAHAEPTALGLDPTGWVALAMIAVLRHVPVEKGPRRRSARRSTRRSR